MADKKETRIFTDGACSGNPGPGGWGAIVLFSDGRVLEMGGSHPETTNNRMELTAALLALEKLREFPTELPLITLYTDSKYLIQGMEQWTYLWQRNQWQTSQGKPVLNMGLWKKLIQAASKLRIQWKHIPAHSNYPGNERCDEIAVAFSRNTHPKLYTGSQVNYGVDLTVLPRASSKGSSKPYYMSYVDGVLFRDSTWNACQERVKGVSRARFKKCRDEEEERRTLEKWGISP